MTIGTIYHYKSDGTWEVTNANAAATCDGLLAVALGAASDTNGMLLRGFAQVSQSGQLTRGQKVYMYDDGIVTGSVVDYPSGDFVRVLGHCVDSGNTNGSASIYFNPSNDWLEIA